MAVKVGINGFGRIGRNVLRAALGNPEIDFVAVNDLTSPATLAHLLKYDSILGNLKNEITSGEDFIAVDGKRSRSPRARPRQAGLGFSRSAGRGRIDRLLHRRRQSQGSPRRDRQEGHHLCPATNEDITIVLGSTRISYDPAKHNIISNASCTTNCLAPVVKVILETPAWSAAS